MSKVIDFYQKIRDGKYAKYNFDANDAKKIGDEIGVNWSEVDFGEFMQGIKEELEHGTTFAPKDSALTNVTSDDMHATAKIALAHLHEVPDYYTRLEHLEQDADAHWEENSVDDWMKSNREKNADVLAELGL